MDRKLIRKNIIIEIIEEPSTWEQFIGVKKSSFLYYNSTYHIVALLSVIQPHIIIRLIIGSKLPINYPTPIPIHSMTSMYHIVVSVQTSLSLFSQKKEERKFLASHIERAINV